MTDRRSRPDRASESGADESGAHESVADRTSAKRLARGGTVLALATLAANAGNYLLNVFLGRWLTPTEFADANLMVTLMLLVTAIAVALQLVSARVAGVDAAAGDAERTDRIATRFERWAAAAGLALAGILIVPAPQWADFFNTESALPFILLGAGMPFYLAQAVGRGVLQGRLEFTPLATTFIVEMIVRVSVGVVLVAFGQGVSGATFALSISFVATWLAVRWFHRPDSAASREERVEGLSADLRGFVAPVAVLLLAQIIINNGDVLISKRFLDGDEAGVYAAIALVGRAVFFLSWSVATTLFPAVAQRDEVGEESTGLLRIALGAVAVIGLVCTVGALALGGTVLGAVFGPEYQGVSGPLARYAFATSMFAMANLIATHHVSTGRVREGWVLVAGAVVQTVLLLLGRSSIDSLITAQLWAMGLLLAAVSASHLLTGAERVSGTRRRRFPQRQVA